VGTPVWLQPFIPCILLKNQYHKGRTGQVNEFTEYIRGKKAQQAFEHQSNQVIEKRVHYGALLTMEMNLDVWGQSMVVLWWTFLGRNFLLLEDCLVNKGFAVTPPTNRLRSLQFHWVIIASNVGT
jgi:hypothetical protein